MPVIENMNSERPGKVASLALVVLHVAERENVHQRTYDGDDEQHALAELVDGDAKGHAKSFAQIDEGKRCAIGAFREEAEKDRQHEGGKSRS